MILMKYAQALLLVSCCTGAVAQSAPADPLKGMKALAAACQQQFDQRPRDSVRQLSDGTWARNVRGDARVTYDVKKTDSLVSPYTAYIKIETTQVTTRGQTEEEARAADSSTGTVSRGTDELRFAFQDANWTLKGGRSNREFKRPGDPVFSNPMGAVELGPDAVASTPALSHCIP